MDRTTVVFIRHATVDYTGVPDQDLSIRLNHIGQAQSAGLRQNLLAATDLPVAAIYSSDLPRALETISPFATAVGLPIRQDPRLREHDYRGDPKIFHESAQSNPLFRHPGGEALHESGRRFLTAVDEIISDQAGRCILVSTHGTVFTEFMKAKFQATDEFYWHLSNPDVYAIVFADHQAVSYQQLKDLLPAETINHRRN